VFVTFPRTVGDVIGDVEQIGRVAGAEAGARETAARMAADLDDVRRRVGGRRPARVLVVVWQDPLRTVGRGTFFEDLIRQAGGEPVLARGEQSTRR
jgi:iron complex transport system substrate-binding protein